MARAWGRGGGAKEGWGGVVGCKYRHSTGFHVILIQGLAL